LTKFVGTKVKKLDDPLLTTGHATFVDDVKLPGMLFARFMRSPYSHAKITKIDISRAASYPGVHAVLTGKDVAQISEPYPPFFKDFPGLRYAKCYSLAVDVVRYVGEPVVVVVAEDRFVASDAVELIEVEYEPLPLVLDAEKALEKNSPLLYPEWGDNVMFRFSIRGGDVEKAFKEADFVLKDKVKLHRYTGTPLETRAYIAHYDRTTSQLTFWASTQQPHPMRSILAESLKIPETDIRVIQPNVGGGFGLKTPPYPEETLLCLLSMKLGRPIKFMEDRSESMVATGHARQQSHDFGVSVMKDGTVTGYDGRELVDLGVFFPQQGLMQMYVTAKHVLGPYKIKNFHIEGYGITTNKTSYFAYRGFGKEAANFVYERIMDLVARELKMDRAAVRMKNFVQPEEFPYETPTGATYDSGNYPAALQKVLEISDYASFKEKQLELRKKGKYIGMGVTYVLEPSGASVPDSFTQGFDGTTIKVDPSGRVTVLTGVTSPGTGNETGIAQVVADQLGVDIKNIRVIQGDTASCPFGLGNFSSRSSIVGFSSAYLAAQKIREKVLKAAAFMLEANVSDLEMDGGDIYVTGTRGKSIAFAQVAKTIWRDPYKLPPNVGPGLETTEWFLTPNVKHIPDAQGHINTYPSYPNGANVATVEVDPMTGAVKVLDYYVVHDCGTIVNPLFVEGQVVGGVAQGLGGALMEELVYDDNGQLLTSTFMDYLLPGTLDVPNVKVGHQVTKSPITPLGTKGCGEGGAEGAAAVLASAIEDALEPFAVKVNETPFTPSKIWKMIHQNGRK
jgi:aerobic carbon-monoxide dehydrogenase large subunit